MALVHINSIDGAGYRNEVISVTERIAEKVQAASEAGATIVVNKSWNYTGRGLGFERVERLSQTNSKRGGKPTRVIWACYRAKGMWD